jgi:hypothetical protein
MMIRIGICKVVRKPHHKKRIVFGPSQTIFVPFPDSMWYEDQRKVHEWVVEHVKTVCDGYHIAGYLLLTQEEINNARNRYLQSQEENQ